MTDARTHWDHVYSGKTEVQLSWHQGAARVSLEMTLGLRPASVIDIGGGTSRYAGALLAAGIADMTVLDISQVALDAARARDGETIDWLCADIRTWNPGRRWDLWHDRAVFHFLTGAEERAAYLVALRRALAPGGHALIATFAPEGPASCSGLPVARYSPQMLAEVLGNGFSPVEAREERHVTPWGSPQAFQFSLFRRI